MPCCKDEVFIAMAEEMFHVDGVMVHEGVTIRVMECHTLAKLRGFFYINGAFYHADKVLCPT